MGHWEVTVVVAAGTRVGTIVDRGFVGEGFSNMGSIAQDDSVVGA